MDVYLYCHGKYLYVFEILKFKFYLFIIFFRKKNKQGNVKNLSYFYVSHLQTYKLIYLWIKVRWYLLFENALMIH